METNFRVYSHLQHVECLLTRPDALHKLHFRVQRNYRLHLLPQDHDEAPGHPGAHQRGLAEGGEGRGVSAPSHPQRPLQPAGGDGPHAGRGRGRAAPVSEQPRAPAAPQPPRPRTQTQTEDGVLAPASLAPAGLLLHPSVSEQS